MALGCGQKSKSRAIVSAAEARGGRGEAGLGKETSVLKRKGPKGPRSFSD